eukprot:3612871-Amphidinium_carterae.1
MTSTVASLLGVPTTTRLTIGMINLDNAEQQPTPADEASLRVTQAQQYRRRRNAIGTPPRTARQQEGLAQQSEQHLAVQENTVAVVLEKTVDNYVALVSLCVTISHNHPVSTLQILWLDSQFPSDS